jgi:hypothetical protein
MGPGPDPKTSPFAPSSAPTLLSRRAVRGVPEQASFAAIVDAAGLTGGPTRAATPTRATFYAPSRRAVPDLFELARVLGHSHVRITGLYTHLLSGHLERSRNAVNLPAFAENSPEHGQSVAA